MYRQIQIVQFQMLARLSRNNECLYAFVFWIDLVVFVIEIEFEWMRKIGHIIYSFTFCTCRMCVAIEWH